MAEWPPIDEPELVRRLRMGEEEFRAYLRDALAELPPRAYSAAVLETALGYPWRRPAGSFELRDEEVRRLGEVGEAERSGLLEGYAAAGGRFGVLAIGSNAAPAALARKFAHFPAAEDRAVVGLAGRLRDFDVVAAAHLALYGSAPATLAPSPGTAVAATLLLVTPAQFTQLAWSELSYRLGRLRARFEPSERWPELEALDGVERPLAFVSRFGALRLDGAAAALAAVPADDRRLPAYEQAELLAAVAALAFGDGAGPETLVEAVFADFAGLLPRLAARVWTAGEPLPDEVWTPYGERPV